MHMLDVLYYFSLLCKVGLCVFLFDLLIKAIKEAIEVCCPTCVCWEPPSTDSLFTALGAEP